MKAGDILVLKWRIMLLLKCAPIFYPNKEYWQNRIYKN